MKSLIQEERFLWPERRIGQRKFTVFIVQEDSDYLDGNYAAFGHVTSGMEIVDQICKDVPVEDDNGTVKAENQPVIEKITITD